ncbi:5'-AMP-activated protein kinase subunit gamma-2-like protein, partial [Leptotrombidium deliense]
MACDGNASNVSSKQRTHLKASSMGANPTVSMITSGIRTRRANTLPRSGAVVGLDVSQGSSASSSTSKPAHPSTLLPKSPVIPFRSSTLQKGFAKLALRKRHGSGPTTPTTPLSSSVPASRTLSTPPPYSVLVSPRDLPDYKNSLTSKMGALLRRHSMDPEARKRANVANQRSVDGLDAIPNNVYFSRDSSNSRSGSQFGSNDPICDRLDFEELGEDENLIYVKFFKFYRCYDLIPISAKLVVFDTQLLVKKAFFALVSNGVRAAPLWDCCNKQFVTMLTITDFINILTTYYKSSLSKIDELEEQKLEAWRNILKEKSRPLISIDPDACLLDAIKNLVHNRIHRLP